MQLTRQRFHGLIRHERLCHSGTCRLVCDNKDTLDTSLQKQSNQEESPLLFSSPSFPLNEVQFRLFLKAHLRVDDDDKRWPWNISHRIARSPFRSRLTKAMHQIVVVPTVCGQAAFARVLRPPHLHIFPFRDRYFNSIQFSPPLRRRGNARDGSGNMDFVGPNL